MEDSKLDPDKISRTRHDFFYMQLATRQFITYRKISKEFMDPAFHEAVIKLNAKVAASGISINEEEMKKLDPENILKEYTLKLISVNPYNLTN